MGPIGSGTLDEAYQWLHATRPEFDGWLPQPWAAGPVVPCAEPDGRPQNRRLTPARLSC